MRLARGYVLALALSFGTTVGAPVALLHVDAPVATAALSGVVGDAAAQKAAPTPAPSVKKADSRRSQEPPTGNNGNASPSDGGGGNSASGSATLHDLVTLGATSDTSMSLNDSPTGNACPAMSTLK
jgi:hypothetical protein